VKLEYTWFALLLGLVGLGLLAAPSTASAHADYERSEPAKDAVLRQAPPGVDVWFTQELFKREGRNFVRVFDEQDAQVNEGDGVVDDDDRTHVSTTLPADLANGRYIVRWKTTSDADGDTDEGAFCFYVGVEPTAGQAAACAALAGDETPPALTPTEPAAVASPTALAPTSAPTTVAITPTTEAPDEDDDGIPTAAIVGGAIGGAVVLVLIISGAVIWLRRTLA